MSYVSTRARNLPGLPTELPKPEKETNSSRGQEQLNQQREPAEKAGSTRPRRKTTTTSESSEALNLTLVSQERKIQYNVRQTPTLYGHYEKLSDEAKAAGHKLSVTEIQNAVLLKHAPETLSDAMDLCWEMELSMREAKLKSR